MYSELWPPSFFSFIYLFANVFITGDIRYPTVAFSISRQQTFAIGPTTTDPRTGEILDADISFAQEWVAAFSGDLTRVEMKTGTMHHRRRTEEEGVDDSEMNEQEDTLTVMRRRMLAKMHETTQKKSDTTTHQSFHHHNCQHHQLHASGTMTAASMRGVHRARARRLAAGEFLSPTIRRRSTFISWHSPPPLSH